VALAVTSSEQPNFMLPGCSGFEYDPSSDPFSEIDFFDGFAGPDWIDMGDFGWPIFDPLDLQSSAQQRVDRCVSRCVGTATGIERAIIRIDCDYRCTQAEIRAHPAPDAATHSPPPDPAAPPDTPGDVLPVKPSGG
jgi:hypothetical protein